MMTENDFVLFTECLDLDVDWRQTGNGNLYCEEFTTSVKDAGNPYF